MKTFAKRKALLKGFLILNMCCFSLPCFGTLLTPEEETVRPNVISDIGDSNNRVFFSTKKTELEARLDGHMKKYPPQESYNDFKKNDGGGVIKKLLDDGEMNLFNELIGTLGYLEGSHEYSLLRKAKAAADFSGSTFDDSHYIGIIYTNALNSLN